MRMSSIHTKTEGNCPCKCGWTSWDMAPCPYNGPACGPVEAIEKMADLPTEMAALKREYFQLLGRVTALEAEVYRHRRVEDPSMSETLRAAVEEARKKREERDQKDLETPVDVRAEDWEKSWLNQ